MEDKENALGSGFMTISPPPKLGGCSHPPPDHADCFASARATDRQGRATDRQAPLYTLDVVLTLANAELLVAPNERKVPPAAPEAATLTLKKFADIPWVSFGDVTPGTTATSSLHLVNPGSAEVHLTVERFPAVKGEPRPVCRRSVPPRIRPAQLIDGHNLLRVLQASRWKVS